MSSSNRRSSRSSDITEAQINDLVSKLQQLIPELRASRSRKVYPLLLLFISVFHSYYLHIHLHKHYIYIYTINQLYISIPTLDTLVFCCFLSFSFSLSHTPAPT